MDLPTTITPPFINKNKKIKKRIMPNMRTSIAFARWVATTCKQLIDNYYGVDLDLDTGEFRPCDFPEEPIGDLVDPEPVQVRIWINAALMFIKTLGRFFHIELLDMERDLVQLLDDFDPRDMANSFENDEV